MPFTPSHVAAVLPLARTGLPPAALVVGSVAPDLPYYLPLPVAAATTHGPAGLWLDVLLGGAVLALYAYVLRPPLHALAGGSTAPRVRAPRSARGATRAAALTSAALAVGSVTHMAWDSFTQTGGALVRAWPLLSTPVAGPHLLYNVLMYASSAGGLAVLAWWVHRERARRAGTGSAGREAGERSGPVPGGRVRVLALSALAVCAVAGAVAGGLSDRAQVSGYDLVRCLLVGAVTGGGLGLAAWTAVWWSRRPLRRTAR
ncbi:DUF4184 family protein [Nocardiopsis sp. HUAS JQ3]|uniref:DUF4184 family protein n=1 Tax=Nocardiopsis sp. HUAS JQ3 TaxID=3061629 RepID=UPI0023A92290|nr:DUF4184 family protein [Nocardiopsis sp. HUAS JQ3]WDZ91373.1 DUF4184 family protein [Nocardiopsis sp. HUAS JQ3]